MNWKRSSWLSEYWRSWPKVIR